MVRKNTTLQMDSSGNILIRKLRSSNVALSEAQQVGGLTTARKLKAEARRIIKTYAPNSSGTLRDSIDIAQNKAAGGWSTRVFIGPEAADYGYKVEAGWGPQTINITPEFIAWAESVIGPKFAKKLEGMKSAGKRYTVRKGNNPRYDTRTGMKFFQVPVNRHRESIYKEYQANVNKALMKAGLR